MSARESGEGAIAPAEALDAATVRLGPEQLSGSARNETWVVARAKRAHGGPQAGMVHRIVKKGTATYPSEGTILHMSVDTPLSAEVLQMGRPLGLRPDEAFDAFKNILRKAAKDLPDDTRFGLRGSAVTGDGFNDVTKKFDKGFFDIGRKSDYDFAVMSPTLFQRARALGVKVNKDGTRTIQLKVEDLKELGLDTLLRDIHSLTGREDTEIVLYKTQQVFAQRGTHIRFQQGLR